MLQQVADPHVILSVRLPLDTYQAIFDRARERGVRLSAEARALLNEAVQRDQAQEAEAQDHD